MGVYIYKKIVSGKELNHFFDIPESFFNKELEITIRPLDEKIFNSLSIIKIDTETFKFNRDEANER